MSAHTVKREIQTEKNITWPALKSDLIRRLHPVQGPSNGMIWTMPSRIDCLNFPVFWLTLHKLHSDSTHDSLDTSPCIVFANN